MGFTVLMHSGPRKHNINIFTTRFSRIFQEILDFLTKILGGGKRSKERTHSLRLNIYFYW